MRIELQEPLILASASPRRTALLGALGVPHEVMPSAYAEPPEADRRCCPAAWAMALAYFKARAISDAFPGRWTLGADTIVVCEEQVLGKPRDLADARRMLELQAARPAIVVTGVALVRQQPHDGRRDRALWCESTIVRMADLAGVREAYLASGLWRGKAGAYGIQDLDDELVHSIEGSFNNVVGLPTESLCRVLGLQQEPA